jgi:hypothetical protein
VQEAVAAGATQPELEHVQHNALHTQQVLALRTGREVGRSAVQGSRRRSGGW